MRLHLLFFLLMTCFCVSSASAQRLVGLDTLYGNEWLEPGISVKIKTTETGIHRVSGAELAASGLVNFTGEQLKLICIGDELPIHVSTTFQFGATDFLEFYVGPEIIAAYQAELYESGDDGLLNRDYPLFSDTLVLALKLNPGQNFRFEEVSHEPGLIPVPVSEAWAIAKSERPTAFVKREWLQDRPKFSHFTDGEGWASGLVRTQQKDFVLSQLIPGSNGELQFRAVSSYSTPQLGERILTSSIGAIDLKSDTSVTGNKYIRSFAGIPASLLGSNVSVSFQGETGSFDRWGVGEARVKYTAALQAEIDQLVRYVDLLGASKGRHLWSSLNSTESYSVYDIDGVRMQRLPMSTEGISTFDNLDLDHRLILVSDQQVHSATCSAWGFDSLQLSPEVDYLIITDRDFENWSNTPSSYAAERRRTQYGGYTVAVWYFDEIRDVFGYGQIGDARCIRNAIQYAKANSLLEHVLILGKGREFDKVRTAFQLADVLNSSYSIPTFGTPGSDALMCVNALTNQLDVGIGRLPVESSQDLGDVQRKVFETEDALSNPQTLTERAWMKRIFHLGGGGNSSEQAQLRSRLSSLKQAISNSQFGPEFREYYKDSDTPVQEAANEELFRDLNKGASIVTIFGHSSPGTFDFNIDNEEIYENRGRYPLLIGLGCYSGSMHFPGKSIGERFVVLKDKGFVGFGATVGLGYPNDLSTFTNQFYSAFAESLYSQPLGLSLKAAYNHALSSGSITYRQLGEQFTYNGDPATLLYKHKGPDYLVDLESFTSTASDVVVLDTEMEISFDIRNIGSVGTDSIVVFVERESAKIGRQLIDSFVVAAPAVARSVTRQIETWGVDGTGLNQIWIRLAPVAEQEEQPIPGALLNNQSVARSFFIKDKGIDLLWPRQMSTIGLDSIELFASGRDPFSEEIDFLWELSENADFSDLVDSAVIPGFGLMSWIPSNTTLEVGRDYFWRVSENGSLATSSDFYSFTVVQNIEETTFLLGSDVQISQESEGTLLVDSIGDWSFKNSGFFITLRNKEFISTDPPAYIYDFGNSAASVRPWSYMQKGLAVVVADKISGSALRNLDPAMSGSIPTGGSRVFAFPTETAAERQKFINFIDTQIPDSSAAWVFSTYHQNQVFDFDAWRADSIAVGDRTIFSALRDRGAKLVDDWGEGLTTPYVFVFRNNIEVYDEQYGTNRDDVVASENFISTPGFMGSYLSGPFPKAASFKNLSFSLDSGYLDSLKVQLVSSSSTGLSLLEEKLNLRQGVIDMTQVPAQINGEEYRIRIIQYNEQSRIARGIDFIRLEYSALPEIVFDPKQEIMISADTLDQGQRHKFSISIKNVSPVPIAEFQLLTFGLESGSSTLLKLDTFVSVEPWGSVVFESDLTTDVWPLKRDLIWNISLPLLEEFNTLNNLAQRTLVLRSDQIAPNLKVTIDGSSPAVDGALVSDPTFGFIVTDNDIYRSIEIDQLELELRFPNGSILTNADLPGELKLVLKKVTNQVQRVEFSYETLDLPDGMYSLKATVLDVSGNQSSGKVHLDFEVVNATAVSDVIPYPNPAVDHVQFQYEATGIAPDDYQIDIYTSAGRRVKSLGPAELGPLRIGRHLTSGFWDGTDEYGQKLARGLYLYRFETSDIDREHRATAIDNWVKNGFGKLVLLR